MKELKADESRLDMPETGIYIRAKTSIGWDGVDLAHLDADSAWSWLTETNSPEKTANTVMVLLGHGQRLAD